MASLRCEVCTLPTCSYMSVFYPVQPPPSIFPTRDRLAHISQPHIKVLGSEPGTLIISASSRTVSGLAALLLDILLLGVLRAESQLLCAVTNLHLVYDKRRPVSPRTSRLGILVDSPVGHISLARAFSLIILLSTACIIVIGFSINGTTVQRYDAVTYRSVVSVSKTPAVIDYDREYEEVGSQLKKMVSRRLAAASDSYICAFNSYTHINIFGYAYRDISIDTTKVDLSRRLNDGECVTNPRFRDELRDRSYLAPLPVNALQCGFEGITPMSPDKNTTAASFETNLCEMEIRTLQCFGSERVACAAVGMGKGEKEGNTYALLVSDIEFLTGVQVVQVDKMTDARKYPRYAGNNAFFSGAGFAGDVSNLANMALTQVRQNVTLYCYAEDINVTEVNLRVAVPMVAIVLGITLLVGVIATVLCAKVVFLKNRSQYNRFSTVPDILQIVDPEKTSKLRKRSRRRRCIGVKASYPVIALGAPQDVSGADWMETEIQ